MVNLSAGGSIIVLGVSNLLAIFTTGIMGAVTGSGAKGLCSDE
jgi:hypothetical protein